MNKLNFKKHVEVIFERIAEDLDFCFTDNKYNNGRTHQVLLKIKVNITQLSFLIESLVLRNEDEEKYINSLIELNKESIKKIDWVYPNGTINDNISVAALTSISTIRNIYNNVISKYEPSTINEMSVDIKNYFNKYELNFRDYLEEKKNDRIVMHYKAQMLHENIASLYSVVKNLKRDEELSIYIKHLDYIIEDISDMKKILNELYQDNNLINNVEIINIKYDKAIQIYDKNIKRYMSIITEIADDNKVSKDVEVVKEKDLEDDDKDVKKQKINIKKYL